MYHLQLLRLEHIPRCDLEVDSSEQTECDDEEEQGEEEAGVGADGADEVDEGEDGEGYVVQSCMVSGELLATCLMGMRWEERTDCGVEFWCLCAFERIARG